MTNHAVKTPEFTVDQTGPYNPQSVRRYRNRVTKPRRVCPPPREPTHPARLNCKCILQGHKTPPQTKVAPFPNTALSEGQLVTPEGNWCRHTASASLGFGGRANPPNKNYLWSSISSPRTPCLHSLTRRHRGRRSFGGDVAAVGAFSVQTRLVAAGDMLDRHPGRTRRGNLECGMPRYSELFEAARRGGCRDSSGPSSQSSSGRYRRRYRSRYYRKHRE